MTWMLLAAGVVLILGGWISVEGARAEPLASKYDDILVEENDRRHLGNGGCMAGLAGMVLILAAAIKGLVS
jgi:hypothetical protein